MSKKIIAGVGIAAALGVAVLPAMGTFAATTTTYIKATVSEFVGCTSEYNSESALLDLGTISAGTQGTGSFNIEGSTNNPNGFNISATPGNMRHASINTETIGYSASAVAIGSEGWFLAADSSSAAGASINGTTGQVVLNSADTTDARDNDWDINVTVSTATTTTVGSYTGVINWTCVANQ